MTKSRDGAIAAGYASREGFLTELMLGPRAHAWSEADPPSRDTRVRDWLAAV
jgi:hypothetical protein